MAILSQSPSRKLQLKELRNSEGVNDPSLHAQTDSGKKSHENGSTDLPIITQEDNNVSNQSLGKDVSTDVDCENSLKGKQKVTFISVGSTASSQMHKGTEVIRPDHLPHQSSHKKIKALYVSKQTNPKIYVYLCTQSKKKNPVCRLFQQGK